MRRIAARWTLGVVLALVAAGCGDPAGDDAADGSAPRIVVTTSILGDVVAELAGDAASVEVLIEAGVDPHGFAPSAAEVATLRQADLVVAVGLGLEAQLEDALAAAEQDGVAVLRVGEHVDPLPAADGHDHGGDPAGDHGGEDEHAVDGHAPEDGHGSEGVDATAFDPHIWFDPVRMATAVEVLADRLAELAPQAAEWSARGERLAGTLHDLDRELASVLDAVPADCRMLVTNHDSLDYLAARYGLDVVGTVIPGASSQAEPSARDLAALADTVRATGAPAIFAEESLSTRLAETLAAEVGRDVEVVTLYTDALGAPGSGAETYVGLLRTDADRIAAALADCDA